MSRGFIGVTPCTYGSSFSTGMADATRSIAGFVKENERMNNSYPSRSDMMPLTTTYVAPPPMPPPSWGSNALGGLEPIKTIPIAPLSLPPLAPMGGH